MLLLTTTIKFVLLILFGLPFVLHQKTTIKEPEIHCHSKMKLLGGAWLWAVLIG